MVGMMRTRMRTRMRWRMRMMMRTRLTGEALEAALEGGKGAVWPWVTETELQNEKWPG